MLARAQTRYCRQTSKFPLWIKHALDVKGCIIYKSLLVIPIFAHWRRKFAPCNAESTFHIKIKVHLTQTRSSNKCQMYHPLQFGSASFPQKLHSRECVWQRKNIPFHPALRTNYSRLYITSRKLSPLVSTTNAENRA